MIRIGGFALVLGAAAFIAVFSYLAASFNYPDVLDGQASEVLPALLETGERGRAVWAVYSLLPLLWIPAAAGAFEALRARNEGAMRLAMSLAGISALAMILGLMRWPSFHWELAQAWASTPEARPVLESVFNATNRYLGNYIGEFLGELTMSLFFLLTASAMLQRDSGFFRWLGWLGVGTAIAGMIGMFRNVSSAVAPVAELNNYLLPVWMIAFGVALLRYDRRLPMAIANAQPAGA